MEKTIKIEHIEEYRDGNKSSGYYKITGIEKGLSYSLKLNEDSFEELFEKIKEITLS